jgi:hypothetical protein
MPNSDSKLGIGGIIVVIVGMHLILYQLGFLLVLLFSPEEEYKQGRKILLLMSAAILFFGWRWRVLNRRRQLGLMHGQNYVEIGITILLIGTLVWIVGGFVLGLSIIIATGGLRGEEFYGWTIFSYGVTAAWVITEEIKRRKQK